ncbi:MAG: YwbE family protein [Flavobacteriales bacterium]|nr:YwbE family protein [Flavobacteriales bacterium]
MSDGTIRANIHIGQAVKIVQKHEQKTGRLTYGHVKRILTSAAVHTRGIKVMLESGIVGRVREIVEEE